MSVPNVCAWCTKRIDEGVDSSGTKVIDNHEPPCRWWELNPGYIYLGLHKIPQAKKRSQVEKI